MVVSSLLYLLSLLLIVLVVNNLRSGERRLNLYQQLRNGVDRLLGAQQVTQGEQLIRSISELLLMQQQLLTGPPVLPRYKFYTEVLDSLLDGARRWGALSHTTIISLRKGVGRDLRFERQVVLQVRGGVGQFLLLAAVTWGYIYFTYSITGMAPTLTTVGVIIILQVSGATIFILLYHQRRRANFAQFTSYQMGLYRLKVASISGVSVGESLIFSRLGELVLSPRRRPGQGPFAHLNLQIESMINRWRSFGAPIGEQLDLLIEELWFLVELRSERFVQEMALIKFFILVLFYLSAYLLILLVMVRNMGGTL